MLRQKQIVKMSVVYQQNEMVALDLTDPFQNADKKYLKKYIQLDHFPG